MNKPTPGPMRFRINARHRGYILVSCVNGHAIRAIKNDANFGGSIDEADLGRMNFHCRDCESALDKIEGKP